MKPCVKQFVDTYHPCPTATDWIGERTLQEAWQQNNYINWTCWCVKNVFAKTKSKRSLRLLAVKIAEHVLPIWQVKYPDDNRPALAIKAAKRYAYFSTEANKVAMNKAAKDAYTAYVIYCGYYVAQVAYTAYYACDSTIDIANVAYSATNVTNYDDINTLIKQYYPTI